MLWLQSPNCACRIRHFKYTFFTSRLCSLAPLALSHTHTHHSPPPPPFRQPRCGWSGAGPTTSRWRSCPWRGILGARFVGFVVFYILYIYILYIYINVCIIYIYTPHIYTNTHNHRAGRPPPIQPDNGAGVGPRGVHRLWRLLRGGCVTGCCSFQCLNLTCVDTDTRNPTPESIIKLSMALHPPPPTHRWP